MFRHQIDGTFSNPTYYGQSILNTSSQIFFVNTYSGAVAELISIS